MIKKKWTLLIFKRENYSKRYLIKLRTIKCSLIQDESVVTKKDTVDYFLNNPNIMDIYEITQDTIYHDMLSYVTQSRYTMTFEEFYAFIQKKYQALLLFRTLIIKKRILACSL